MALTPDQQLGDVINQLHGMTNGQLKEVVKAVEEITEKRQENRRKELWGNVVAAIAKYESEIGQINFYCGCCGEDCTIDEIKSDDPGNIIIG